MTKSLADLLAMDSVARAYGCALKPKLRQAIEADLRFPVRASTTRPDTPIGQIELPQNVHRLSPHPVKQGKKRA